MMNSSLNKGHVRSSPSRGGTHVKFLISSGQMKRVKFILALLVSSTSCFDSCDLRVFNTTLSFQQYRSIKFNLIESDFFFMILL